MPMAPWARKTGSTSAVWAACAAMADAHSSRVTTSGEIAVGASESSEAALSRSPAVSSEPPRGVRGPRPRYPVACPGSRKARGPDPESRSARCSSREALLSSRDARLSSRAPNRAATDGGAAGSSEAAASWSPSGSSKPPRGVRGPRPRYPVAYPGSRRARGPDPVSRSARCSSRGGRPSSREARWSSRARSPPRRPEGPRGRRYLRGARDADGTMGPQSGQHLGRLGGLRRDGVDGRGPLAPCGDVRRDRGRSRRGYEESGVNDAGRCLRQGTRHGRRAITASRIGPHEALEASDEVRYGVEGPTAAARFASSDVNVRDAIRELEPALRSLTGVVDDGAA
jgi:hypothetical protein